MERGETMDGQELMRIATVAAKKYQRRVWWASFEDMRSEALVAVVQARKTWDPDYGVTFGAYAYRAAILAIRPYLWRNSSPVSESWHKLPTLSGVHRTGLVNAKRVKDERWPADDLDHSQWRELVTARLLELDPSKGLAVPVVLGVAPEEVAEMHGVPVEVVKKAASKLRSRARNDYPLWKLHWKEDLLET
jgi:DNA-directed RNA polymerase specialized sigma24 family protein